MSLDTWKEEFYPIDAHEVASKDAIQHSLTKWIGLRPENLNKHDLTVNDCEISDAYGQFPIDGNTCSLCVWNPRTCGNCPIVQYKLNGSISNSGMRCTIEYHDFAHENDPEPMIDLLQQTIKFHQTTQAV